MAEPVLSVTSNEGIVWNFANGVQAGQYYTGDYWVKGPVVISGVSPSPTFRADGSQKHGSMLGSQLSESEQGFDGIATFHIPYASSLNIANYIGSPTPVVLSPGDRLISVSSGDTYPPIRVASVLTCVSSELSGDYLRPGYTDGSIDGYPVSSITPTIDRKLCKLDITDYLTKDLTTSAAVMSSVSSFWFDPYAGINAWIIRPSNSMPVNDTDLAATISNVALALNTAAVNPLNTSSVALHLAQKGIDDYSNLVNLDNYWAGPGPQGAGKKFTILFAGHILNHEGMKNIGYDYPVSSSPRFPEDAQTFIVASAMDGEDVVVNDGYGNYALSDVGLPEWGQNHWVNPELDSSVWVDASSYGSDSRRFFSMKNWMGYIYAAKIMGLEGLWNHDPLFLYFNRYYAKEMEIRDEVVTENIKEALAPADFEWMYDYVSGFNSEYFASSVAFGNVDGTQYHGIATKSNMLLYVSSYNPESNAVTLYLTNPIAALSSVMLIGGDLKGGARFDDVSSVRYVDTSGFGGDEISERIISSTLREYTINTTIAPGKFYVQILFIDESTNSIAASSNVVLVDPEREY